MADAQLEAKITLNAQQFEQEQAKVKRQAQEIADTLNRSAQTSTDYENALKATAAAMGLSYDKQGRLRDAAGRFAKETDDAVQSLRRLEKQLEREQQSSAGFIAALNKIGKGFDEIKDKADKLDLSGMAGKVGAGIGAAMKAVTAGVGVMTAAAAGGLAYIVREAGQAQDLLNDAMRLNIETADLQRFEFAARRVGLSGEKVRDMFKDVNEKIGDFIMTGGGEAADVFNSLGLNARDFIGLAPDKALERIGAAMAGLSEQDKSFILESLANDASFLIPLLDENAAKLHQLRDLADARGMVVSDRELAALNAFKQDLNQLAGMIVAFSQQAAGFMAAPLRLVLDEINALAESLGGMDNLALAFAQSLTEGLASGVEGVAALYVKFQELGLFITNLRAMLFSLADGFLAMMENVVSASPVGWADKIFGSNIKDGLASARQNMQGVLGDLAEERLSAEQNIAKAQAAATVISERLASGMRRAMEQTAADKRFADTGQNTGSIDEQVARASRFAQQQAQQQQRQEAQRSRSLAEYDARMLAQATEQAQKENERMLREQEKMLREQQRFQAQFSSDLRRASSGQQDAARTFNQAAQSFQSHASGSPYAPNVSSGGIQDMGRLAIDINLNGDKLAGVVMGSPKFLSDLKIFVERGIESFINQRARAYRN